MEAQYLHRAKDQFVFSLDLEEGPGRGDAMPASAREQSTQADVVRKSQIRVSSHT